MQPCPHAAFGKTPCYACVCTELDESKIRIRELEHSDRVNGDTALKLNKELEDLHAQFWAEQLAVRVARVELEEFKTETRLALEEALPVLVDWHSELEELAAFYSDDPNGADAVAAAKKRLDVVNALLAKVPKTRCDSCAAEFSCFDGSKPCVKVPKEIK
jgi:hypothetical protein